MKAFHIHTTSDLLDYAALSVLLFRDEERHSPMKLPDSKYRHVIIPHGICRQIEGLICGIHPPCGAAYL